MQPATTASSPDTVPLATATTVAVGKYVTPKFDTQIAGVCSRLARLKGSHALVSAPGVRGTF